MPEAVIKHAGIVSRITDNEIEATIAVSTACDGCHAGSSCGMAGNTSRIITISHSDKDVKMGDQVNIVGSRSAGISAVIFAYILPFIAVMLTLILSLSFGTPELRAGLYSILILPPYYLVLYFFREKFEKKYTFRIVS